MERTPPIFACDLVATANRQIGKYYASHFEALGLSFPRIQILNALHRRDGRTPSALAAAMAAKASSMTALLDNLEQSRLVVRRRDPKDRRAVRIYLTERGRARRDRAMTIVRKFNSALAGRLSSGELSAFARVMKTVEELTAAR